MSWLDASGTAICISSFCPFGPNQLPLNVGDRVVLLRRFEQQWIRGHLHCDRSKVGIFPTDCIIETSDLSMNPQSPLSLPVSTTTSIIHSEIFSVIKTWRSVVNKYPEQSKTVNKYIQRLAALRRQLTTLYDNDEASLTLKDEILDLIGAGSQELGLDTYLRSASDGSPASLDSVGIIPFLGSHLPALSPKSLRSSSYLEEPFSDRADHNFDSKPLSFISSSSYNSLCQSPVIVPPVPPLSDDSPDIYSTLLSAAVFSLRLRIFSVVGVDSLKGTSSSTTSSHPLFSKALDDGFAEEHSHRSYLHLFLYSSSDDASLSETLVIPLDQDGKLVHNSLHDASSFLFSSIQSDIALSTDIFLVVRLCHVTPPVSDYSSLLRKGGKDAPTAFTSVLVPLAVGVFNVSNVVETIFTNDSDVNIKLVSPTSSTEAPSLHKELVNGYPPNSRQPFRVRMSLSALIGQDDHHDLVNLPFLTLPEPCSSLYSKHSIYFTIHSAVCLSYKNNNKTSARNIEPEVCVVDRYGKELKDSSALISPHLYGPCVIEQYYGFQGDGSQRDHPVRLPVVYHSDDPKFEITLAIKLKPKLLNECYLRVVFRHVSSTRGRDSAFAVGFIPFCSDEYFLSFLNYPIPLHTVHNGRLPSPNSIIKDLLKNIPRSTIMSQSNITFTPSPDYVMSQYLNISLSAASTEYLSCPPLVPTNLISSPKYWTDDNPPKPSIVRNAVAVLLDAPIGETLQNFGLVCFRLVSALAVDNEYSSSVPIKDDSAILGQGKSLQVKLGHMVIWTFARLFDHAYHDTQSRLALFRGSVEAFILHKLPSFEEFYSLQLGNRILTLLIEISELIKNSTVVKQNTIAQGLRSLRCLFPFLLLANKLNNSPLDIKLINKLLINCCGCLRMSSPGGFDPYARVSILMGLSKGFQYCNSPKSELVTPQQCYLFLDSLFDSLSSTTLSSGALLLPLAPWIALPSPEPFDPGNYLPGEDFPLTITLPIAPPLISVVSIESIQSSELILCWISSIIKHEFPNFSDINSLFPSIVTCILGLLSSLTTRHSAIITFIDLLSGLELNSRFITPDVSNYLFGAIPFLLLTLFSTRSLDPPQAQCCHALEGLVVGTIKLLSKFNQLENVIKNSLIQSCDENFQGHTTTVNSAKYLGLNNGVISISWLFFGITYFYHYPPFPANSVHLHNLSNALFHEILGFVYQNLELSPSLPLLNSLFSCILSGLSVPSSHSRPSVFNSETRLYDYRQDLSNLIVEIWGNLDYSDVQVLYPKVLPRALELLSSNVSEIRKNGVSIVIKILVDLISNSDPLSEFDCPRIVLTSFVEAVHRHCHQTFITSIGSILPEVRTKYLNFDNFDKIWEVSRFLVNVCQDLFGLLVELKNRSTALYQLPETVEATQSILEFSANIKLKKLYEFHMIRLENLLKESKHLSEAAFCLESYAVGLGLSTFDYSKKIKYLREAAELYRESYLLTKSFQTYDLLKKEALKFNDFQTVSDCLHNQSIVVKSYSDRLPIPAYYRVSFYTADPSVKGSVSVTDYVYHSCVGERLAEFVAKLQAEFPNAKLYQKRSKVSLKQLNNPVIQVTSVQPVDSVIQNQIVELTENNEQNQVLSNQEVPVPFLSKSNKQFPNCFWCSTDFNECECSFSLSKSNYSLLSEPPIAYTTTANTTECKVFVVSRAEIIDENNAEDKEVTCLRTVFEYFVCERSFPCSLIRVPIVNKFSRSIGPIESACVTISQKNSQLRDVISEDLLKSSLTSVDSVSMILQGCVEASINGGIARYAKVFLDPDKVNQFLDDGYKADLIELNSLMKQHFELLGSVLKIHRKHCSKELLGLQVHLESLAKESKQKFITVFEEFERIVGNS
ncbi:hypothetical protein P9112_012522 [Eukaryota sp. TZLM1-RC]